MAAAAWAFPLELEHEALPERDAQILRTWDAVEKRWDRGSRFAGAASTRFVYDGACAGRAVRAGLSRRCAGGRPLPMEDIAFFAKELDNSGLRRDADPSARRRWVSMIGVCGVALLAAMLCFGPRAWLRHSGYRQADLLEKRDGLVHKQRQLLVAHEELTDLRRVARMAASQGLDAPGPDRVAWQELTVDPVREASALAQSFGSWEAR